MKIAVFALALVVLSLNTHAEPFSGYPDWAKQAFTSKGNSGGR